MKSPKDYDPIEAALRSEPDVPESLTTRLKDAVESELAGAAGSAAAGASVSSNMWVPLLSLAAIALLSWGVVEMLPESKPMAPTPNDSGAVASNEEQNDGAEAKVPGALAEGGDTTLNSVEGEDSAGSTGEAPTGEGLPAIHGVVRGEDGSPLANAKVAVTLRGSGRESKHIVSTGDDGEYFVELRNLPAPVQVADLFLGDTFHIQEDPSNAWEERWEAFHQRTLEPAVSTASSRALSEREVQAANLSRREMALSENLGIRLSMPEMNARRAQAEKIEFELQALEELAASQAATAKALKAAEQARIAAQKADIEAQLSVLSERLEVERARRDSWYFQLNETFQVVVEGSAEGLRDVAPASLHLRGDERAQVDIELVPSFAIRGQLGDAANQPVAGAQVEIVASDSFWTGVPQGVQSDRDGNFVIEGAVAGLHALKVTSNAHSPLEVLAVTGEEPEVYRLEASPVVEITLHDASGTPLSGAVVLAKALPSVEAIHAKHFTADEEGRVYIQGIEAGDIQIAVHRNQKVSSPMGMQPDYQEIIESVRAGEHLERSITVEDRVDIDGFLQGAPDGSAQVLAYRDLGHALERIFITQIKDGRFHMPQMAPDVYLFAVAVRSGSNWQLRQMEEVVVAPNSSTLNLRYDPVELGTLELVFEPSLGGDVGTAFIEVKRHSNDGVFSRRSSKGFRFIGNRQCQGERSHKQVISVCCLIHHKHFDASRNF